MKRVRLLLIVLIILVAGIFLWNDSLYDKEPELPLSSEQVKFICCYPEDFNPEVSLILDTVNKNNSEIIITALKDMDLIANDTLQKQVAESGQPWWGTELCKLHIELNTDFWHRTPDITLYLFEDGHVMMKCSSPSKPYPEFIEFDHEYSYLHYYKAQSENYAELTQKVCDIRKIYYGS